MDEAFAARGREGGADGHLRWRALFTGVQTGAHPGLLGRPSAVPEGDS